MNRELEALDKLIKDYLSLCEKLNTNRQEKMLLDINSPYNILKQYLESVDRADFSEALECLNRMLGYASLDENDLEKVSDDYNVIKLALVKAHRIIKQEEEFKQALIRAEKDRLFKGIVINHNIRITDIRYCKTAEEYNDEWDDDLTDEEFNFLKEMV